MFVRQTCINCHSLKLFKLMDLLKLGYTHKQAALLIKNTDQSIILNYHTN